MIRLRNLSLRNKLVSLVLTVVTVSLVVGFTFWIINDIRLYKSNMVNSTVLLAKLTGDYCVSDLAFSDREASVRTLQRLVSTGSADAAFLLDVRGDLFASYVRGSHSLPKLANPITREFRGNELIVSEPIAYEGERYGTIVIASSTALLDAAIRQHLVTMTSLLLVLVLISLVLVLLLERIISRPILALTNTAREISEKHDYALRVTKTTEDEIGVLCDGFNDMLGEIERREQDRNEADRRTRAKSHFLANMSHELRTPLNAIIGFSEVLLARFDDGRIDARETKFLQNIHTSGEHLLGLVNDILDLSKVEAGLMEMRTELLALEPTVEGVSALMKSVSARKNVLVEHDLPPDLPTIEADPIKIKQILYNLISNAIKFSHEGSVVTVRAEELSASESPIGVQAVRLQVIDRGIGIDPADHDAIFDEFRQLDAGRRQAEGTGLGLALVRKLAELHHGQLSVESVPGAGSTFSIVLPTRISAAESPAAHLLEPASDRPLILVVEDEMTAYRNIERILVDAGYMPVRAISGEEAVRMARALAPAAITLDLVLPGTDGWDVLRTLRGDPLTKRIPVIIVSMLENRDLGVAFGADDYLLKPVSSAQLLDSLARLSMPSSSATPILVVSEDSSLHEVVSSHLGRLGYAFAHSYAADDALLSATAQRPALIILDLSMRTSDGMSLALHLKKHDATATIPTVVVTPAELDSVLRHRLLEQVQAASRDSEQKLVTTIHNLLQRNSDNARVAS